MTKAVLPLTPERQASRIAAKARYRAKNIDRIRAKRKEARIAANTPTLSLVQSAQINSPTSVWAYAARSAT